METPVLTPDQNKDIQDRSQAFKDEVKALTDKYQVDFVSYPVYVSLPDGHCLTKSVIEIQDKKYAPVPSPFMKKEGEAPVSENPLKP